MRVDDLSQIPGIVLGPPAAPDDLEVADALLRLPLPPGLVDLLAVCDGARVGEVEVFSAERLTDVTNAGAHSWQLPDALVIGRAGAGRALVMIGQRDEVSEVDSEPWDARTLALAADTPADLFFRHGGVPLRDRERWWAAPSLGPAIEESRRRLLRDLEALLAIGIGSRVGQELPTSLAGVQRIDVASGLELLVSEAFGNDLLNDRPDPPAPGACLRAQWSDACEEVVDAAVRDRVRTAPLPERIARLTHPVDDDGDLTPADIAREHAFLALLAQARHELRAIVLGGAGVRSSPASRLVQVYLAGHIPVGRAAAI